MNPAIMNVSVSMASSFSPGSRPMLSAQTADPSSISGRLTHQDNVAMLRHTHQ